jgi:hypothetical protein
MAGDWIPMRKDLWDCPEVVRILSATCPQNVRNTADKMRRKCEVVGALFKTWSIFDTFSEDGTLAGYDADSLNEMVGLENWAQNLQHVGWLLITEDSLEMPSFTTYLSKSAKRRMKDAERKKDVRKTSAVRPQNVRIVADKKRTTEEKRTEEKSNKKEKQESGSKAYCSYLQNPEFAEVAEAYRKMRTAIHGSPAESTVEAWYYELCRLPISEAIEVLRFSTSRESKTPITNGDHKKQIPTGSSQTSQSRSRFSLKDIPV